MFTNHLNKFHQVIISFEIKLQNQVLSSSEQYSEMKKEKQMQDIDLALNWFMNVPKHVCLNQIQPSLFSFS